MSDSKKIEDGGLAFPGTRCEQVGTVADFGFTDDESPTYVDVHHSGMSLRDWFAGQALAGMTGVWLYQEREGFTAEEQVKGIKAMAKYSYHIADAMIAARKAGAA